MTWFEKLILMTATVLFMDCFAWATLRYVMHGCGWGWHRSHHEPQSGVFEKNDLYALTSAALVVGLFVAGMWRAPLWWAALGITRYGGIYAFVHDMMVHQRFGMRWVRRRGYVRRLLQANGYHHAVKTLKGGVGVGFLLAQHPARPKRRLAGHLSDGAPR